MHVHGSFSEGVGSIDSHSHEASDLGVDVIWWSDHDFRITSYHHVSSFGFEDWNEPLDRGEAWHTRPDRERFKKPRKTFRRDVAHQIEGGAAELTDDRPQEGLRSLRIRATGDTPAFALHAYTMAATRDLFRRPLAADVSVSIAVRPEELGPDARAAVLVGLSEHAPHEDLPREIYSLRYVLDNEDDHPSRRGSVYTVPLPYRPGEWNAYELHVTEDAVAGFPFLEGRDNSLHELEVGVEARRGATATASFDALEIEQRHAGPPVFGLQRGLIDTVGREYPDVHQLQGVEMSYTRTHLNEFSVDTGLIDYDDLFAESDEPDSRVSDPAAFDALVSRRAVEAVHARGGLVSYNHLFGVSREGENGRQSKEELFRKLLENRVYGADILEVGYRARGGHDLADHLWVWDRLAQAGLRLVGTGVSDSHGGRGQRWRTSRNNFVSWIYADSTEKADLIEGLRHGRVYFGDPAHFDGKLDLWTDGGQLMGALVRTAAPRVGVTVAIEGCEEGDVVRLVQPGRPDATSTAAGDTFREHHEVALAGDGPSLVRVEVTDGEGRARVYGNPIYFLPPAPAGEGGGGAR